MALGVGELLIILLVVVIVFGAGRLGELGEALPKAVKSFQAGSRGDLPDPPATVGTPQPQVARSVARHRLRPVGLVLIGVGLLVFYANDQWLQAGLPLHIAAGVLAGLGVLVFLFF